ncbi:DUF3060 domain-containing protein [Thermomonas sp.]|uniref:DUF3060 domain-containing protein n=1 Tax=Thermomonas sp. TaxID=1971895 RepID=UPI0035ADD25C
MKVRFLLCSSILAAGLLSLPAAASERVWNQVSSRIDYTCKAGEAIAIEGVGNIATFSGNCGSLRVEGAGNVIRGQGIDHLLVDGSNNQVEAARFIDIDIEGTNNRIAWMDAKAASPKTLRNDGTGNLIQRLKPGK